MISSCLQLLLVISTLNLHAVSLPGPLTLGNKSDSSLSISNFHCSNIQLGASDLLYDAAVLNLTLRAPVNISCGFDWSLFVDGGLFKGNGSSSSDFTLTGGGFIIDTETTDKCFIRNATVKNCSLGAKLADLRLSFDGKPLSKSDEELVEWLVDSFSHDVICGGLLPGFAKLLMAPPPPPPPLNLPPPVAVGAEDIRTVALFRAVREILNNVPERSLDGLKINASLISSSTARLELYAPTSTDLAKTSLFSNTKIFGGLRKLIVPAHTTLLIDIACVDVRFIKEENTFTVHDLRLLNVRLLNTTMGEVAALVDDGLSSILVDAIDAVLPGVIKNNDTLRLPFPNDGNRFGAWPSTLVLAVTIPSIVVGSFLLVFFVWWRYCREDAAATIFDGETGERVPPQKLIADSVLIVTVSAFCLLCFVFFGTTTYASSVAGSRNDPDSSFTFYSYILIMTIRDFWKADMRWQAILVALWSGVWPYLKIITILTVRVVMQSPQNRFLHFLDQFGKYSLLDGFLLQLFYGGLELPHICFVDLHSPFYAYILGTLVSILLGNFATGGHQIVVVGCDDIGGVDDATETKRLITATLSIPKASTGGGGAFRNSAAEAYGLVSPNMNERLAIADSDSKDKWWNRGIAVFCVLLIGGALIFSSVGENVLTYTYSGLVVKLFMTEESFGLWALIANTPAPLAIMAVAMVFVAPILLCVAVLFIDSHRWVKRAAEVISAWSALDAFCLGIVVGIFQMHQFVATVVGPLLSEFVAVKATPDVASYALLCVAAASSWLLVWRSLRRIPAGDE